MTTRLEAAMKAWDHYWGDRYGDEALEEMGEEVKVALAASDAVLLSDATVERAARALFAMNCDSITWGWRSMENHRQSCMNVARVVLAAALKEDGA